MKKTISILGAGGKMGKWFAKYFLENGFQVIGYDSENEITNKSVIKAESLVGAVHR